MVLLKHGNFEFHNILSNGYSILEDEPDVLSEITMADGAIKRNYGEMPKTTIEVKFGQLNQEMYLNYMSHFQLPEDEYTYYSPRTGELKTKRFFVKLPKNSLLYGDDLEKNYDEFTVVLEQCGED